MFNTIMMMFSLHDVTDVGYNTCMHAAFQKGIIKILFKKHRRLWYHFVPNLLEYKYAKNYKNRA